MEHVDRLPRVLPRTTRCRPLARSDPFGGRHRPARGGAAAATCRPPASARAACHERLLQAGGKICCVGAPLEEASFRHYVEEIVGIPGPVQEALHGPHPGERRGAQAGLDLQRADPRGQLHAGRLAARTARAGDGRRPRRTGGTRRSPRALVPRLLRPDARRARSGIPGPPCAARPAIPWRPRARAWRRRASTSLSPEARRWSSSSTGSGSCRATSSRTATTRPCDALGAAAADDDPRVPDGHRVLDLADPGEVDLPRGVPRDARRPAPLFLCRQPAPRRVLLAALRGRRHARGARPPSPRPRHVRRGHPLHLQVLRARLGPLLQPQAEGEPARRAVPRRDPDQLPLREPADRRGRRARRESDETIVLCVAPVPPGAWSTTT